MADNSSYRQFLVGAPKEIIDVAEETKDPLADLAEDGGVPGYAYPAVVAGSDNVVAVPGQNVRYDASTFTGTLFAPANPTVGQRFAYKEMGGSETAVSVNGNGNNIEEPISGGFQASYTVGQAYIGVEFEFDGTQWIIP